MAMRTHARRLYPVTRASSESLICCRGFANAALKVEDDDDLDVKSSTVRRPRSAPQYSIPFYDMFPLGRGTSLLGLRDIVDDVFGKVPNLEGQTLGSNNRTSWDVMEDEKAFELRLDMPGLCKDEVKVDVQEGNLLVKGEKKPDAVDDWCRRSTGSYNVRIKLPDNVRADLIKAELKNGVLKVTAPKVEDTMKTVSISID